MAEDEDDFPNKKIENSNKETPPEPFVQTNRKPDLGIEEEKFTLGLKECEPTEESTSTTSRASGSARKEDNPFSFKHFLKRDLSLPSNATYENTGARPKVYASTVQHSPIKLDIQPEPRREKPRVLELPLEPPLSDHTASSSSVEIPLASAESSDSKRNLFVDSDSFYQRPAAEPLGMPSLPDFVQDHILVEQAYLNSNSPICVDLDNLPDFTFTYQPQSAYNSGRRHNGGGVNYDYDVYSGASTSGSPGTSRPVPLDLPENVDNGGAPIPLDLPPHINLDLTESVNPSDRRNNSPRNTFPLDLPPNAGAESMRLPDFLPVHPGRTSPEPDDRDRDRDREEVVAELERTRAELAAERARRGRAESECRALRAERGRLQSRLAEGRQEEAEFASRLGDAAARVDDSLMDAAGRATEAETTVNRLRRQIKQLKEDLAASEAQVRALRGAQGSAARELRHAAGVAETSLRELLSGLTRLRALSGTLEPP